MIRHALPSHPAVPGEKGGLLGRRRSVVLQRHQTPARAFVSGRTRSDDGAPLKVGGGPCRRPRPPHRPWRPRRRRCRCRADGLRKNAPPAGGGRIEDERRAGPFRDVAHPSSTPACAIETPLVDFSSRPNPSATASAQSPRPIPRGVESPPDRSAAGDPSLRQALVGCD